MKPEPASLLPSVSLPKGGGALRGIGDKLAISAATGTGSWTVPIAVSPGRGGFTPDLALSYDSGGERAVRPRLAPRHPGDHAEDRPEPAAL